MVSHESGGVTRPRPLFNVALLRRGSCPGRTRTQPAVGIAAQRTLSTPPHAIAAEPPDRGTSRLQIPSAFSRPWQWTTLGLPCPVSFPTVFPAPPDFSTGTFHNRSPHNRSIHEQERGEFGKRRFSPLSTGRYETFCGAEAALGPVAAACCSC